MKFGQVIIGDQKSTIEPLKVCWLLLVLLKKISRLIQDVTIFRDKEISIPFMNLKLLQSECK